MKFKQAGLTALFVLSSLLLQAGGRSADSALHLNERNQLPPQMVDMEQYDDVLEIEARELKQYITFKGNRLSGIVKVSVSCYLDTRDNKFARPVRYQDLWFRRGDPLGAKHFVPFPIKEYDQVGVFVKGVTAMSEAEAAALASALVRLRLQLTLNRNHILTIRVPNQSLEAIVQQLRKQNFLPYREVDHSTGSLIPIQLETEMGRREVMCFVSK